MSGVSAVVLVEGVSDRAALGALAKRFGRDLKAEGVSIVSMGGASAIGESLDTIVKIHGPDVRVAGLCDRAEVGDFQRAIERAGLGSNLSRSEMESMGFFVCTDDLEDELIRALGVAEVEQVIEAEGELSSFRTFQNQPAWRGQAREAQLRRFIGTKSGRKARYGFLLVDALDLTRVPQPLEQVLAYALAFH
ncbi:MAG: TOPRIM nucleotidyl transferase/hydrolase domain-containing protein [Acidimicrobiia bacterium]